MRSGGISLLVDLLGIIDSYPACLAYGEIGGVRRMLRTSGMKKDSRREYHVIMEC